MLMGETFAVEWGQANCDDPRTVAEFSEGQLIALRRDKLGWTQADLARKMGVSHSTVQRVEKDTNKQRPNYVAALAIIEKEETRRGPVTGSVPPAISNEPSPQGGAAAHADAAGNSRRRYRHLRALENNARSLLDQLREILDEEARDYGEDDAARHHKRG